MDESNNGQRIGEAFIEAHKKLNPRDFESFVFQAIGAMSHRNAEGMFIDFDDSSAVVIERHLAYLTSRN